MCIGIEPAAYRAGVWKRWQNDELHWQSSCPGHFASPFVFLQPPQAAISQTCVHTGLNTTCWCGTRRPPRLGVHTRCPGPPSVKKGFTCNCRLARCHSRLHPCPPANSASLLTQARAHVLTGDVCVLYNLETRAAYQIFKNTSACSCYNTCAAQEACGFYKACPARRRRADCQTDALVRYDTPSPCPR